jgi:hypothetical protein
VRPAAAELRDARLTPARLRAGDCFLLRERAAARGRNQKLALMVASSLRCTGSPEVCVC